jgi:hypothetical protein
MGHTISLKDESFPSKKETLKDESFPSKERPLLGRLESRRVREGLVPLWRLCSSFRIK